VKTLLHAPRESRLRWWLWQLHLYGGVATGLVLVALGLTGSLLVYLPELRRAVVPGGTAVEARGEWRPLQESLEAVQRVRPGDRLYSLYLDGGRDKALNFRTVSPRGERIHTFVDPYTARVMYQHNYEQSTLEWFFRLHAELLMGDTGLWVDGWFGLTLAFLSLSGIVLWWRGVRQWRRGLAYERRASWKRQMWDAHNLAGFVASILLFIVAISGAYYSFPATYRQVAAAMTRGPAQLPAIRVNAGAARPLDALVRAARAALPGAEPTMVNFPVKPGATVSVRLQLPSDMHRIGYNYVLLDPATARVVRVERFSDLPLGVRAMRFMTPLHYGTFGGTFTRVLYVALGLVPLVLFVTGLAMWWNRVLVKKLAKKWQAA